MSPRPLVRSLGLSIIAAITASGAASSIGCGGLSGGSKDGSGGSGAATASSSGATSTGSTSSAGGGTSPATTSTTGASSSSAASSSSSGSTTGCSSLPLCDDFESDTAGMPPDPSLWTVLMGCNPNMMNTTAPTAPGGGLYVEVDAAQSHSGKNSLRVVGGDSCGYYAINTSAFATLGAQVYVRFWARFSGTPTQNHNGFASMYTGTATNFLQNYSNSTQLRLGFQGDVIAWNYSKSDATLPDIDPMGEATSAATPANDWSCIEFHLDQTTGDIEFWLQPNASSAEASVAGLSYSGTSTQGVNDQWHSGGPSSLMLKSFGLGWLGLNDQYTAWYDDVALGNARIGCQ
jgi:hypothetical protein